MKKGKGIALVVVVLLLALVGAGGWLLFVQPGSMMDQAKALQAEGDFSGAQAIYAQMNEARVLGMQASGLPFGRYREAETLLLESRYAEAEALMEDGQYEKASRAFAALGDYRSAGLRKNEPYHRAGALKEAEGAYAEAALLYEKAGDFSDAPEAYAYCMGREALAAERYVEAEEWLTKAAYYADAAALLTEYADEAALERDVEARKAPYHAMGQVVEWGSYEQDGDPSNGAEPIRWLTLGVQDNQVKLIAEQALACKPYHAFIIITWENSDLRSWLNGVFLWNAFDEVERAALRTEPVDPESFSRFGGVRAAEEADRVTMLSDSAVNALDVDLLKASGTAQALAEGLTQTDGYASWWLRMDGYDADDAAAVGENGEKRPSLRVDTAGIGVRPVIWLDLDALIEAH